MPTILEESLHAHAAKNHHTDNVSQGFMHHSLEKGAISTEKIEGTLISLLVPL